MSEENKTGLTDKANDSFKIQIGETANVPAVTSGAAVSAPASAGGLTYQTARADEKTEMDKIIAGIDLTNSDTIIALGSQERQQLADLADKVLDSVQPSVKIAFAEALKGLIDAVKENSLEEIKKRIQSGTRSIWKALVCFFTRKDYKVEVSKKTIENFMTDISGTRKTIEEMIDKLQDQQVELDKNFGRINDLGRSINTAAQDMRVVRAASAEYIRRVEAGEITVLADLEKTAKASGRSDDMEKLQLAQANWNNIRIVDGDLLGSINVYDMNVANLAFTKQANLQNRIQTATTLTTTIAEWKTQLAIFAVVTTEKVAGELLKSARQLTEKSVQANKDLFDELVDITMENAGRGTYSLRQVMETQNAMAAKLEGVGAAVDAQFEALKRDKEALAASSTEFRNRMISVFTKEGGVLSTPTRKPGM